MTITFIPATYQAIGYIAAVIAAGFSITLFAHGMYRLVKGWM
jgi:hypothetical protein